MTSMMVQRSTPYAIFCRLCGCFFIHNFRGKSLRNAKVALKSRYTFYSFSWFLLYMFLEALFSKRFGYVIRNISDPLSRALMLVVLGVGLVKLITNLAVMILKPDKLLAFFRESEAFEMTTEFLPQAHSLRNSAAYGWHAVRAFSAVVGLGLFFIEAERFIIVELSQSLSPQWSVPLRVIGFVAGTGYVAYDSLSYFFLRNCTKVLVKYIQVQVELFQKVGKLNNFYFLAQSPHQVEAMRLRINKIKKLKESLNAIWAEPLIVACAGTIIIDCVVVDALVHDGIKKELWLAAGYSVYSTLCFIDLAHTGQTLIDEVRKLKSAILMVPAFGAPESCLQQLRYLHESVQPEGMGLSGGSFFVLKRSLLLSMTGSIIIFGVILIQTSNTMTLKVNAA
ncbi:hypothetical protein IscW_ISCW011391 [Ixodes scapularis]|uniref:Uncharacterized protein n=1 Tax=Ixodes scapularis TaxID=6945 RepID=B7Q483_IXOSC|nr:hypothetical protein IscW_ISCW011391 [Ixodes scapularis]|eukprot:XP_002411498.1 hypothetical protein IscW_ISCW011391 [Ixodes scapularis]